MIDRGPLVHLIYGSDTVRIYQERRRLIGERLPAEHRAENLTELEPAAGRMLALSKIAADLMSELATPSFFPEVPRVMVVEQLQELFGSGGRGGRSKETTEATGKGKTSKKATEVIGAFCRFLEADLPETGNVLILTAVEEPDKWRLVSTSTKLFKTIQKAGRVSQHKEPAAIFALVDAFSSHNLAATLQALNQVLERDDGVASAYRMLTRQVRFLIQAKLLEKRDRGSGTEEEFAARHFPDEKGLNLLMEHQFVAGKVRRAAPRWTLAELNAILARMEQYTKIVYPSSTDVYVPDPATELEVLLIDALKKPVGR